MKTVFALLPRFGWRGSALLTLLTLACGALRGVETAVTDADGLVSYLYTPSAAPDPTKTYWLVVGVHGAGGNGKGACGVAAWATTFDDVIVLGPTFAQMSRADFEKQNAARTDAPREPRPPGLPREAYQMSGPLHEAKLKAQIAELGRTWKLHPKIFLHGFSAGAQFSHRFAFKNPELVAAVSAHSAGSWATTEGDDRINLEARAIPFALSCGEADNAKMTASSRFSRIEACRAFAAQLLMLGFNVQLGTWPRVAHTQSAEATALGRTLLERVRTEAARPAPPSPSTSAASPAPPKK